MGESRIKKVFAVMAGIISTLTLAGVLYGCDSTSSTVNAESATVSAKNVFGAVLPHHLLVSKDIDQFYAKLAEKSEEPIDHVVLISPNHFAYGLSFVQTTNVYPGRGFKLNLDLINGMNANGVALIEPIYFDKEHGIFAHFDFVEKYFPYADITSIIIKRGTPKERLDILSQFLREEVQDNTLIIASIDFTHFEGEEFAKMDDDRTLDWLQNWSNRDMDEKNLAGDFVEVKNIAIATYQEKSDVPDTDPVAIDSPESLYVMSRIFSKFEFEKRTSSALILKTDKPESNTTHIFGIFSL